MPDDKSKQRRREVKLAERDQALKDRRSRRDRRVAPAMEILGSDSEDTRRQVEWAMGRVARQKTWKGSGLYGTWTPQQKEAARNLAVVLRKLKVALNNPNLASDAQPDELLRFDERDFEFWITRAEQAADKQLSEGKNPHKTDRGRLTAAMEARVLLEARGLKATLTRKGRFDRLAAILYGTPGKDFLYYCGLARKTPAARRGR